MMHSGPLMLVPVLSTLATLSGVILLVFWAIKHLTAKQLWQVGCLLLLAGLLLPLVLAVFSGRKYSSMMNGGKGGIQMKMMQGGGSGFGR